MYMTPSFKIQVGMIVFSIIGAIMIVGTAWLSKGSEAGTWLYVFSIWMILFSALQIYGTVAAYQIPKLARAVLVGASAIIMVAWWANGAEHMWLFLTSVATMLVAFFILKPHTKE
jgi:hypothetical protein